MVLMRRKDKRRGNEAEEIIVASDSSIVANKGVRSLSSARTGRFAADMRVQIGGYGRADKTWGVDHPWHKTREEIVEDISSRDHMEEGLLVKQEQRPQGHGLSRAALKKKKAKMKKGGLTDSTAGSEMGSEAPSSVMAAEPTKKEDDKVEAPKENEKTKEETKAPAQGPEPTNDDEEKPAAAEESKSKKRKRANRNKKKLEKARAHDDAGDISDDDSDLDASVEQVAKAKKKKAAAEDAQPTQVVASSEKDKNHNQVDAAKREAIAKEYESAFGQEFTTESGLTIRDIHHGQGRVPAVGEMITVRYRGRIDDKNGIVFGKGMLSINYGTGSVIAGWEEGMGTMRTGGIRHLTVPPSLAYGSVAKGTKIPANATLFFEVELVRMGKRKRDAIAKDEIPLPSSFQRKKTPVVNKDSNKNPAHKKSKSKGRRRKHSI